MAKPAHVLPPTDETSEDTLVPVAPRRRPSETMDPEAEWKLWAPHIDEINEVGAGAAAMVGSTRRDGMRFTVETELESETGRWIAEVMEVGAMQYGATREEAVLKATTLALRVLADRLEHGEATPDELGIVSEAAAA